MSKVVDCNAETMLLDQLSKESQNACGSELVNSMEEEVMSVEDDEGGREDKKSILSETSCSTLLSCSSLSLNSEEQE